MGGTIGFWGEDRPVSEMVEKSQVVSHGRIVSVADQTQCLDIVQLNTLEQSFRQWVAQASRARVSFSRRRILLIFLLIRFTGAKLNEVLGLNPRTDIAAAPAAVLFRGTTDDETHNTREVYISDALAHEMLAAAADPALKGAAEALFAIDPGFIRRKFYERAQACGFDKRLGGPEMIRKARAVELMQANMPLPAVQMLLGHSTPNLTSAYVSFSKEEIRKITQLFIERESTRKTSARNFFFGKIQSIQRGDIQSRIELITISGQAVVTVITNDSLERLGLHEGRLVTAEVKAPWVILHKSAHPVESTAENKFFGEIRRIQHGRISTECVVALADGTELCAIVTTHSVRGLNLAKGDTIWALFSSFAAVLHVD
jgi:molybdate transport system regulatory protein